MHAAPNRLQKANCSLASSDEPFVDWSVRFYPIHIKYEEKWWQHTTLQAFNSHGEGF